MKQKQMQRPWRGAADRLDPHGLLSLLSYSTQDPQPRDGPTHSGLCPPPSVSEENRKKRENKPIKRKMEPQW